MKLISLTLATLLFLIARAFADGNYRARYCEIFIPQVTKSSGPFGAHLLNFHLKILSERLDGEIVDVGIVYKGTVKSKKGFTYTEYHTERARKICKKGNLFLLDLPVSHDDADLIYEGSFYVKTGKNTTYWLNTRQGGDFVLSKSTYAHLNPTDFNPDNCY